MQAVKGRQEPVKYNFVALRLVPLFFYCVERFPLWFLRVLVWITTTIYYPFFTTRRHNYQANLMHVLGRDVSNFRLFRTSFRMCLNYGFYMIDFFRFDNTREGRMKDILSAAAGYEYVLDALEKGKGAIMLTAHLGNWELGGIILSQLGHPVNVVYFPDGESRIEENRTRKRLMRGVKEIRLDPDKISPIEMARALTKNEIVCLQGDKLYHDSGVKVKFFDAEAFFPRGPVLLSMLTGAPILPSFILMDKGGRYSIIVEPPIYPEKTGDRERDIKENQKKIAAVFEKMIGRHYDQWYCFTKFWGE